MKKYISSNNGLTLLALVITVIIIILLASVSIYSITDNGLFGKAKLAKLENKRAGVTEWLTVKVAEEQSEHYSKENINENDVINTVHDKIINKKDELKDYGAKKESVEDISTDENTPYFYVIVDDDLYKVDKTGGTLVGSLKEIRPSSTIESASNTSNSITVKISTDKNNGGKIEYYIKEKDEDDSKYKLVATKNNDDEDSKINVFEGLEDNKDYTIKIVVVSKNGNRTETITNKSTKEVPNLTKGNITFEYDPTTELTDQDITVTAKLDSSLDTTGFKLMTSKDGDTWEETNKQKFTENGTMYAVLWDGLNYGGAATAEVTNIDRKAFLTQKFTKWKNEADKNIKEKEGIETVSAGDNLKKYIPSIEEEYKDKFIISGDELYYIGTDEFEKEVAKEVGIKTDLTSGKEISKDKVEDIVKIYDDVLTEKDKNKQIGKDLDDEENLVITYNDKNEETGRYGTGYKYVSSGTYTVDDKTITIKDDYVLNYDKQEAVGLDNYKNWNSTSQLAVTDKLSLNVDPINLKKGQWITDSNDSSFKNYYIDGTNTNIQKTGDVEYDENSRALKFNESPSNPNGSGGYIKLTKKNVDFSTGFTFEIYANLSRFRYDNGLIRGKTHLGLFSRMPSLNSTVTQAMRFGYTGDQNICKFNKSSSWVGVGRTIQTKKGGGIHTLTGQDNCGYNVNQDFYLTFVYVVYDANKSADYRINHSAEYASGLGNYDQKMDNERIDKILYYVNGQLFGYTYYGHDSYINGCNTWNNDNCPFFVGVCPWGQDGSCYYLKGKVYACRLYQKSMIPSEVKANRDATMQYRASFDKK